MTRQATLDSTKETNSAKKRASTKGDKDIEAGVKKLEVWQAKLDNIILRYREAEDILSSQDIAVRDNREVDQAGIKLKNLEVYFSEVRDRIEFEDESRELYSGTTAATEKVSYPMFKGQDNECYQDFKIEIEKAFTKNKVTRSDKVKKLRECLRGYPKKLVPESIKDIDVAYEALNHTCSQKRF